MEQSILTDIKKMLGIMPDQSMFDAVLLIHINSGISQLSLLGLVPEASFLVTNETTWLTLSTDLTLLSFVRPYLYSKVKIIFDPPMSAAHVESLKESIKEFEYKINLHIESEVSET